MIHEYAQVAELALRAARQDAKVLIIRNTVSNAVATQEALEQAAGNDPALLFSVDDVATLHHSRFAPDDRRLLDAKVEERLGRIRDSGGLVVVGTQTLEQSLDIDADLLITDLCPVDVLLQRIGRLHRHRRDDRPAGHESPRCVVLTPDTGDLSPLLQGGSNRTGLGPHGYVYEDLRVLEATRRLIRDYPEWRIPEMNRLLVENGTHPDALEAIVEELGEAWKAHALDVEGKAIAEVQGANSSVVRRDKSFFGIIQPRCAVSVKRRRAHTHPLGRRGHRGGVQPAAVQPLRRSTEHRERDHRRPSAARRGPGWPRDAGGGRRRLRLRHR